MIASHIERKRIDFPDWETRFSGNGSVRYILCSPEASDPIPPAPAQRSRAGRPPAENICEDGQHFWVSKGSNQAKCCKCPRVVMKHLLPSGTVIHNLSKKLIAEPAEPILHSSRCEKSETGEHRWLSKGRLYVRCFVCRKTAKRKV